MYHSLVHSESSRRNAIYHEKGKKLITIETCRKWLNTRGGAQTNCSGDLLRNKILQEWSEKTAGKGIFVGYIGFEVKFSILKTWILKKDCSTH